MEYSRETTQLIQYAANAALAAGKPRISTKHLLCGLSAMNSQVGLVVRQIGNWPAGELNSTVDLQRVNFSTSVKTAIFYAHQIAESLGRASICPATVALGVLLHDIAYDINSTLGPHQIQIVASAAADLGIESSSIEASLLKFSIPMRARIRHSLDIVRMVDMALDVLGGVLEDSSVEVSLRVRAAEAVLNYVRRTKSAND